MNRFVNFLLIGLYYIAAFSAVPWFVSQTVIDHYGPRNLYNGFTYGPNVLKNIWTELQYQFVVKPLYIFGAYP